MDTLIFILIFGTLLAMTSRRRWLALALFLLSLATTLLPVVAPPREGPFHFDVKINTDVQDEPVVVAIDGVVSRK